MEKHLHIISPKVPYPPESTQAADIFYKIKALNMLGVKIHLHCPDDHPKSIPELEKYVTYIYTYNSSYGILNKHKTFFNDSPPVNYKQLIKNLTNDQHPILFEGVQKIFLLKSKKIREHYTIVRPHFDEVNSFYPAKKLKKELFKRLYNRAFKNYKKNPERLLTYANTITCISPSDYEHYKKTFRNVRLIPAFHPYVKPNSMPGKGRYILYYGNLTIPDNIKVAEFLLDQVFPYINVPVLIAGKAPTTSIKNKAAKYKHILLKANPSNTLMQDLVANAQITVIPTFVNTGIKIRLLEVLFRGRHCIVNSRMVKNTGLEGLCTIKNYPAGIIKAITLLFKVPFNTTIKAKRRRIILKHYYSPLKNAEKIADIL